MSGIRPAGRDIAGFPSGRRVTDNLVAIELRVVGGAILKLARPSYTPDAWGRC